jgi:hypothetical protein
MVGFEFANNGATLVHGLDVYEAGLQTAREIFSDIPSVQSRFEICDLTGGVAALKKALGSDYQSYDIILFLAVDHKLQRLMSQAEIDLLVAEFASRTKRYFAYRGRTGDHYESICIKSGLKRVQYSEIGSHAFGAPAIVWGRK